MRTERLVAIINPTAGGNPRDMVRALNVDETACHVETVLTSDRGDGSKFATEIATRPDPPDIIVAVGGDGTVGEVVTGLYRAREAGAEKVPPLLIAPGGTGNSSYKGLWDDLPWTEVARRVATDDEVSIRAIDLAEMAATDEIVFLGSATGLLPAALQAAKNLPGSGRELLMTATVTALSTYKPYPGCVYVDGQLLADTDVLVTNIGGFRFRGGLIELLPKSLVDDEMLDVCVVSANVNLQRLAEASVAGGITDVPGVYYGRGKSVHIQRIDGEELVYEHDGDIMPIPRTSYAVNVLPHAIDVVTPKLAPPWFSDRSS